MIVQLVPLKKLAWFYTITMQQPEGWSPLLLFSKKESGPSPYQATMAGISAKITIRDGVNNSWIDGELHFYTAGASTGGLVDRMVIDKEGNVGIGGTPTTLLDVNGDTTIRGNLGIIGNTGVISPQNSGAGYLKIQGGGTNNGGAIEFRGGGNSGDLRFFTGTSGAGTKNADYFCWKCCDWEWDYA